MAEQTLTAPEGHQIHIKTVLQQDPRLGRQMLHDERSRGFALAATINKATWTDKSIRIYDPTPNPNQTVGNCTMCAKAMQLNASGNRKRGRVLDMPWAMTAYEWETAHDQFPGQYPGEDTGSNGLASCKTAQHYGVGGGYYWMFGGADEVVQAIMEGHTPSLGTWWENDMFYPDADHLIHRGGGQAGGHQYVARGYWKSKDRVRIRCWWGTGFRDVWIARTELDGLILDGGDSHVQVTL